MPVFAVYGASGFGREVMPFVRDQLHQQGIAATQLLFVDDNLKVATINGHRILTYAEFLSLEASRRYMVFAIANSIVREKLTARCSDDGVQPLSVMAANVIVLDNVQIGDGVILCPFVNLTSNIRIGRYFHANIYSYVAHDCVIGDYVTFAPAVKCNGNVLIEDHAYIGAGAVIKQGQPGKPLVIGRGAIVGMGAVVTKDVPAGGTVVGNPAKLFSKN
ncbi:acetyltransferase [Paralcaligenes sp. KSB-10]|uniref:acetyltransferase n=1 Tax=Paralcaligenes sp. KSB-10 TaxID=2901142 RepID=UPI001E4242DA|nr:acetyltransferase [Paralcaligenes sp. KSB-10]UHL66369.1 acetyltransferase [Paralcaligenes sp. KSB-10]